jgi:hypothetical protein
MNEWGKKLSPRARERLEAIEITPEDRIRLKADRVLKGVLARFYQGKMSVDELCAELQSDTDMKGVLVREAQIRVIESLGLGMNARDFKERGRCILVLEKTKPGGGVHSQLKAEINATGELIKRYVSERDQAHSQMRERVRRNPNMRMKRAKTPQGEVLVQLSEEEAIMSSPEWHEFSSQHERAYTTGFGSSVARLKEFVRGK